MTVRSTRQNYSAFTGKTTEVTYKLLTTLIENLQLIVESKFLI